MLTCQFSNEIIKSDSFCPALPSPPAGGCWYQKLIRKNQGEPEYVSLPSPSAQSSIFHANWHQMLVSREKTGGISCYKFLAVRSVRSLSPSLISSRCYKRGRGRHKRLQHMRWAWIKWSDLRTSELHLFSSLHLPGQSTGGWSWRARTGKQEDTALLKRDNSLPCRELPLCFI